MSDWNFFTDFTDFFTDLFLSQHSFLEDGQFWADLQLLHILVRF